MAEEQHQKEQQAASWLVKILTGWGVPGTLARVLAGAIVGAVAGFYLATATSCTAEYTQNADGSLQYHGSVVLPQK